MAGYKIRQTVVQREVFGSFTGEGDYGDDKVVDVIAWLGRCLDAIPEEYRSDARLDVDSVGGYEGEHHTEIEIYYERSETAEEKKDRKAKERLQRQGIEAQERAALGRLKAKYEK